MNDKTTNSTPLRSVRALLAGSIDYAGLFPPSQLTMDEAAANYAEYLRGEHSWLLGRFVLPVARLAELRESALPFIRKGDDPWRLSVLAGENIYETIKGISTFNKHNADAFLADSLEVKANTVSKIENTVAALPTGLGAYFEISPSGPNFSELVATLAITRQRAKIRTGGVTPQEFPRSRDIIRFVRTCLAGNVPYKATAGLHHPIRCFSPLTYAADAPRGTMHGFLNLFLMTGFARESLKADVLEALMEEEFGEAFTFDENGVSWRAERELTNWHLERLRKFGIHSFGSCSFEEPVEDLQKLGIL